MEERDMKVLHGFRLRMDNVFICMAKHGVLEY